MSSNRSDITAELEFVPLNSVCGVLFVYFWYEDFGLSCFGVSDPLLLPRGPDVFVDKLPSCAGRCWYISDGVKLSSLFCQSICFLIAVGTNMCFRPYKYHLLVRDFVKGFHGLEGEFRLDKGGLECA